MDIDTDKLTQEERDELAAKLAEPPSPISVKVAFTRATLAENGLESVLADDELRAIILAIEALGLTSKHAYAGDGGACKICGMAPDNADAHYAAITASLTDLSLSAAADGGTPWTATLCVAGVPTVDSGMKRLLARDGGAWLPLPLPLALMDASPHADMVTKAPVCGRIDNVWWAGDVVQASGIFADSSDDPDVAAAGSKAAALVGEGLITGISVDLVDVEAQMRPYSAGAIWDRANDPVSDSDNMPAPNEMILPNDIPDADALPDDGDEPDDEPDGDEFDYVMCFDEWTIAGATICPVQALTQARIALVASSEHGITADWRTTTTFEPPALTASAAGLAPLEPPREWFDMPEADKLTPITVTDDGQVFGHIAAWDSCHTGFPGQCVPPPRSPSNYAGFHLGELKLNDGSRLAVGTLTMDTSHAAPRLNAQRALAHYDNTGTAAAYVRASDGRFGIWVAGSLSARLSAEDAQALMASKPSGDWRQVFKGHGRELIAALQVNVPGFPVPRALTASGLLEDGGDVVQVVEMDCVPCAEDFGRQLAVLAASADGVEGLAALAETA